MFAFNFLTNSLVLNSSSTAHVPDARPVAAIQKHQQQGRFFSCICFVLVVIFAPMCAAQSVDDLSVKTHIKYFGVCDGSAIVRLDSETLLAAHDEANSLLTYDIWGGNFIEYKPFGALLNLPTTKEMDIEAVTRKGGELWWIGSHGRDGKGRLAPNRRVLFATNVPNRRLSDLVVRHNPQDLTNALLASPQIAAILTEDVRKRKPKNGGVNIEGLTTDTNDDLLVGFRSPLTGDGGLIGHAMIVTISRTDNAFVVRQVHMLDLANRGIRDIQRVGERYVVVAGRVGNGSDFALYDWDGRTAARRVASKSLIGLNPESIMALNNQWLVASDDGRHKRPDSRDGGMKKKCGKIWKSVDQPQLHPDVFFRARVLGK